jgi:hypothetical protein
MKMIRTAASDWLETEFSVPVFKAMSESGKARRLITDGERVGGPFAGEIVSLARAETNTMLIVPAA